MDGAVDPKLDAIFQLLRDSDLSADQLAKIIATAKQLRSLKANAAENVPTDIWTKILQPLSKEVTLSQTTLESPLLSFRLVSKSWLIAISSLEVLHIIKGDGGLRGDVPPLFINDFFSIFRSLQVLKIDEDIQILNFGYLQHLKKLTICGGLGGDPGIFWNDLGTLTQLTTLYLEDTQIRPPHLSPCLPPLALRDLTITTTRWKALNPILEEHKNKFKLFSKAISQMTTLESLILQGDYAAINPAGLKRLKHLTTLKSNNFELVQTKGIYLGDKFEYEGGYLNHQFHGKGTLRGLLECDGLRRDGIYTGDFYQGQRTGRGTTVCDDMSYEGDLLDGKAHGQGKLTNKDSPLTKGDWVTKEGEWENGKLKKGCIMRIDTDAVNGKPPGLSKATGEFKGARIQGPGMKQYSYGSTLEGEWDSGDLTGHARATHRHFGSVFEGDFQKDFRVGPGILKWRSGAVLEGQWDAKLIVGNYTRPKGAEAGVSCCGPLKLIDGDYEGEYLKIEETNNVFPHGRGVLRCNDGVVYDCDWLDGIPHGAGHYEDPRAEMHYQGQFEYGSRTGKSAIITWNDLDDGPQMYKGDVASAKYHGYGTHQGRSYSGYKMSKYVLRKGNWVCGDLEGKASCAYEDGSSYEGDFEADAPHGKGVMKFANGRTLIGNWEKGRKISGTLISADGTKSVQGEWKKGRWASILNDGEFFDCRIKGQEEKKKAVSPRNSCLGGARAKGLPSSHMDAAPEESNSKLAVILQLLDSSNLTAKDLVKVITAATHLYTLKENHVENVPTNILAKILTSYTRPAELLAFRLVSKSWSTAVSNIKILHIQIPTAFTRGSPPPGKHPAYLSDFFSVFHRLKSLKIDEHIQILNFGYLQHLKELTLCDVLNVPDQGTFWNDLGALTQLNTLYLEDTQIQPAQLASSLSTLTNLRDLTITRSKCDLVEVTSDLKTQYEPFSKALSGLTNLESLFLQGNYSIINSSVSRHLKRLKMLVSSNTDLAEDGRGIYIETSHLGIFEYEGEFLARKCHGKGFGFGPFACASPSALCTRDGSYTGDFYEGRITGRGIKVIPGDLTYEGEFLDGDPHGKGKQTNNRPLGIGDWISKEGVWEKGSLQYGCITYLAAESVGGNPPGFSKWFGEFQNDCLEGQGTREESNGFTQKGNFIDDKLDGRGTTFGAYYGLVFDGAYSNGFRVGQGTLKWRSGAVLKGRWDGKLIVGDYTRPKGVEDAIACSGSVKLPEGDYEGEYLKIEEGETSYVFPHGRGVLKHDDGSVTDSDWLDGVPHGDAIYQDPSENLYYEGEFEYGSMTGKCTVLKWKDFDGEHTYEGGLIDRRFHGVGMHQGSRFYANKQPKFAYAAGNWVLGKLDGKASCKWQDGTKYDGNWKNDELHGEGIMTFPDGTTSIVEWEEGVAKIGTLVSADGTKSVQGYWRPQLENPESYGFTDQRLKVPGQY